MTTAGVVAQVWRSGARQARIAGFVRDGVVVPFDAATARRAGIACEATGTSDVVDASLAVVAAAWRATVLTSDVEDLERLNDVLGRRFAVVGLG